MARPRYVVVDTNVWIAFHHNTDTLHERAKKLFKEFEVEDVSALVTDYVIQEVFSVTSRVSNQPEALLFYDYIINLQKTEVIDINSILLKKIVEFIQKRKLTKPLGIIDYSLLFIAELVGCPIASFDKQLIQSAKKVGVTTW